GIALVVCTADADHVGVAGPGIGHGQRLGHREGDAGAVGQDVAVAVGSDEGGQQAAGLVVGQARHRHRVGGGSAGVGDRVGVGDPLDSAATLPDGGGGCVLCDVDGGQAASVGFPYTRVFRSGVALVVCTADGDHVGVAGPGIGHGQRLGHREGHAGAVGQDV